MKRCVWLWELGALTFIFALGSLLHFTYEWTDLLAFAPFSAVNESTWEHMKILFFPALFFALFQWSFFKDGYKNFWWIKLAGISLSLVLVPTLFYTYNGAFGKSPDFVNILIFFLSALAGCFLEWRLFMKNTKKSFCIPAFWAVFTLVVIALFFIVFTFAPPALPIFQPPNA